MDIIHYLITPLVGGVIGYVTNDIAAFLTGGFSVPLSGGIAIVGGKALSICISSSSKMEHLFDKLKAEIVSIKLCIL